MKTMASAGMAPVPSGNTRASDSLGAATGAQTASADDSPPAAVKPQWLEPWLPAEGAARARDLFVETFAASPDAERSSPGHVTLMGDHTDYSGGTSLATIAAHRAYVAASARDDGAVRVVSGQAGDVGGAEEMWESTITALATTTQLGWFSYVGGVLWAFAEHGYPVTGMDIAIQSCVPIGAGLDSSAALQCAVALAVNDCWGLSLDTANGRTQLAEIVLMAETQYVGVPSGGLGPHTILQCGENEGLHLDFATQPPLVRHRPLYHREYGLCLLAVDTRDPHSSRDGQLAEQRQTCERAAAELGVANLRELVDRQHWEREVNQLADPVLRARASHVVTEMQRVELVTAELSGTAPAQERFATIGEAMYRSHASLDQDFQVSTRELNLVVDTARIAGALGARLMGAGLGGAALVLVRRDQVDTTAQAIDSAFIAAGLTRPLFFTAKPRHYVPPAPTVG